jgi:hypothetical protein
VSEVSEGATCVFIPGKEVPLIVQKSDGGFGYASTDMAALKQRVTQEKADWIIYVTDVGQAGHFDLVFAAGRRVGWLPAADSSEVRKWAGWVRQALCAQCVLFLPGSLADMHWTAEASHAGIVLWTTSTPSSTSGCLIALS